jgi:hypothetical protein
VIFTFSRGQAREGVYYGPLLSNDVQVVHNYHRNVLSSNFKQISTDIYDINDNCVAAIKLFGGTTGLGRTIITVNCR